MPRDRVVRYEMFRGTLSSWPELFEKAASFATQVGRENLISISHSEDQQDGVIAVWYWGDASYKSRDECHAGIPCSIAHAMATLGRARQRRSARLSNGKWLGPQWKASRERVGSHRATRVRHSLRWVLENTIGFDRR